MTAPAIELDDDDYFDTGLFDFTGPIALDAAWGIDTDEPPPLTAEQERAFREYRQRRDLAAGAVYRTERESQRAARQALRAEDRSIAKAWRTGDTAALERIPARVGWMPLPANDNALGTKQRGRFNLTWFADIAPNSIKRTFVKGVFGDGEFTVLSGLPGSSKSLITTDGACHVAAGMPWHGRAVRQGLVVYIAAERKLLTERRMLAFRKRHGVGDIPLLVMGGVIDLVSANLDAKAISAAIKEAEVTSGQTCVWIIVDTLTRVFGGGDQHAPKDMGAFVRNCDLIREATGAHLTAIHHTTWSGERGKGAIDLDGAVDASFLVKKRAGGAYVLECDGANDGEEGPIVTYGIESEIVGVDEDGEPTTAPVVVAREMGNLTGVIRDVEPAKPTVRDQGLDLLREVVSAIGVMPEPADYSDGAMVVKLDAWRERFYDAFLDLTPEAKRQSFNRCRNALRTSGTIAEMAEWVWIT
ncbi:MAG: hypothetical protein B7Z40_18350 [Bosea sp. 12-68-7]|nr:MAG: hypothetical protein B7Z40_18350 [Bosea sp. 12-68-7]